MAYPPAVPPATRTDATVMATNHPSDHNLISAALTEILNHIATLEATIYPIGTITEWGGDTAPPNHAICNGQAVSRTANPEVFAIYGTKFGVGDGTNTFNLPNYTNRSPIGVGSWALATLLGTPTAQLPNHQHGGVDHLHGAGGLYAAVPNHQHYGSGDPAVNLLGAIAGSGQVMTINNPGNGPGIGYYGLTTANGGGNFGVGGQTGAADRNLNTQFAGVDPTNGNYQPCIAVNFIIRMH